MTTTLNLAFVTRVEIAKDVVLVSLRVARPLGLAPAPTFLFEQEDRKRNAVALLEWLLSAGDELTFESARERSGLPQVGSTYGVQGILTKVGAELVADLSAKWIKVVFDAADEHEHCLLTGVKISSDPTESECYLCERYGYVSASAYETMIFQDCYGIRERCARGLTRIERA